MRFRPLVLPLLAAALLGACTATAVGTVVPSAQAPTPPPSTTGGPIPPHGTFDSTKVTGHQLVAGTNVALTFGDSLSANAGCNTMSGQWAIKDGKLDVGQMATTEMGCQADLMAQDQWLAKFLPGAAIAWDGTTVTLTNGDVTMTLVSRASTSLPLEGTTWTLNALITGDVASSVPQGVTATLVFKGGKVMVDTGCNTGSGEATDAGTQIVFGAIALTRKACTTWAGAVEAQMVKVLSGAQPYSISGASLSIGGAPGGGLMFVGPQPSAGPS